jgi:hypothetical protein
LREYECKEVYLHVAHFFLEWYLLKLRDNFTFYASHFLGMNRPGRDTNHNWFREYEFKEVYLHVALFFLEQCG